MKKHLKNIAKIIAKFKKDYKFKEAYLVLRGAVDVNSHSRVCIDCNDEFDQFTRREIKDIEGELYETIRKYLDTNKIDNTLYIDTIYNGWAVANHSVYFKEEVNC